MKNELDTHAVYPSRHDARDHPGCLPVLIALCFVLALLSFIWLASLF